jgi:type IV secretory pathway protease TraF
VPTISQKELRDNAGEVLRRPEAGEEFTVTVAGVILLTRDSRDSRDSRDFGIIGDLVDAREA